MDASELDEYTLDEDDINQDEELQNYMVVQGSYNHVEGEENIYAYKGSEREQNKLSTSVND